MFVPLQKIFTASGRCGVNFYFESGCLGVSDNHRMAYPFFVRKAGKGSVLVHLDMHADCEYFRAKAREELTGIDVANDLQGFANHRYLSGRAWVCPVTSGNWIPALLDTHPDLFDVVRLICHKSPGPLVMNLSKIEEAQEDVLWRSGDSGADDRCFSIDVDYYFDHSDDGYFCRSDFDDPVKHFKRCLSHILSCPCSPLFVALSPESCGGWKNVMPFLQVIDRNLDVSLAREVQKHLSDV